MEEIKRPEPEEPKLYFTKGTIRDLLSTRKWTLFLAILGFIFMGLMVILGFGYGAIMESFIGSNPMGGASFLIGFVYLVIAGIYFFPLLYLYRFSTKIKSGILNNDQKEVNSAFHNLNSHYTFIGILAIIALVLYAFALISIIAFFPEGGSPFYS